MRLHIGCRDRIFNDEWVNLDIQGGEGVDIIDDAAELKRVEDGSCDIIYSSHLLEHFGRNDILSVLRVWHRKLKDGGILRLSVPNFESIVQRYLKTRDIEEVLGLMVGSQKNEHEKHLMIFDEKLLTNYLYRAGFRTVAGWNWREVDHSNCDDYSQAYLPHMDKDNGLLMSLNLEALK